MTTLLPDRPVQTPTTTRALQAVAWVDEQPLSEQRAHLRVGQELRTMVAPAGDDLVSGCCSDSGRSRRLLAGPPRFS